jgi:hypothetical protein
VVTLTIPQSEQIKTSLTIKPADFYLHATPRKDMLIDPDTVGLSKSVSKASRNEKQDMATDVGHATDDGQTKVYIYYGMQYIHFDRYNALCLMLLYHRQQRGDMQGPGLSPP